MCLVPAIGIPPSFTNQPADAVVHETILHKFSNSKVNLILQCGAEGDPSPSITWFRGNKEITSEGIVLQNGSIGLNVTEGGNGGAARTGTLYHCRATNNIGVINAITFTIRSRNANVSYACELYTVNLPILINRWAFIMEY